jgi:hypothetical protein
MKPSIRNLKFISLILIIICAFSCQNNSQERQNGDIEFNNNNVDSVVMDDVTENPETEAISETEKLKLEGWVSEEPMNGNMSDCYNYRKKFGNIDNYLTINVGGNTNVVVKLMDNSTDLCIRYVYVNQSSSYTIRKIPEGIYYLKIAYGFNWMTQTDEGNCIGKFTKSALYEKGTDLLDYNVIETVDGTSIPSYEISLDVHASNIQNEFNSTNISENEFNN